MKQRHATLSTIFAQALADLPRAAGQGIAIAFSGGLDSAVLLHLAHDVLVPGTGTRTDPGAVTPLFAFHIHHGLSPNADAWETHCAAECAKLGVTFAARRVVVAAGKTGTEASARQARYAALGELCREHGVTLLLTAHHLDDQAETILLQLARGAGPAGLSGMDACNHAPGLLGSDEIVLARPLLAVARAQLEAHAQQHGIARIDDESNDDTRYARNALRHTVMPALAAAFPGYQERFARGAAHVRSAQRLLTEVAEADLQAGLGDDGSLAMDHLRGLGEDRRSNLLRHWFGQRGFGIPSAAWLAQMTAQLLQAREDANLLVEHPDCDVRRYRGRLTLAPKLRDVAGAEEDAYDELPVAHFRWAGEASIPFPDYGGTLHVEPAEEGIPAEWLTAQMLTISFRRGGERLKPARNRPTRDLKQHYQTLGIPAWQRTRLPVVGIPGRLLYAAGIGMDCHHLAREGDNRVIFRWSAE
ncbi:tRNA(Ile)-lysidine synthase [Pseudoduganella lurida]|uniref:tRNA(Ile)-lysidine synthase n=1 Tax=Pseudoduganella lurida TaxID=1036180 RepID=A0A562RLG1_9BURK|nr:tRNA lysidine(34) synthetase TilS [Pseudoduganella lurida]TWI69872.1 tRNA(Ile)-lysidine synthase [Pseudoduganella lurida]